MFACDGRAQWPSRSPLLLLLLLAFCLRLPTPSPATVRAAPSSSPPPNVPRDNSDVCAADTSAASAFHVTAVVVGATGNLAAKYLWVALFRLALRASLARSESFAFIAGASDPPERGEKWLRSFFNAEFERRVCGSNGRDGAVLDEQARVCTAFYRERFVPSVQYMPLRSETHYRDVARRLNDRAAAAAAAVEVGRLVYLAIPPDYFLQACELVNRFLRISSDKRDDSSSAPFLRVVIEKPFGTSAESAQTLATGLKRILRDHEIYLMDHYAGKPGVRAWRSYLERNRELLHPLWSSRSIRHVEIEMIETETLEGRIQYFHSTGIVRDVMVNHLHLLLGFTIAPSSPRDPLSLLENCEEQDREQRLAFTKSLRWSRDALHSWQYAEYRMHYELDVMRGKPTAEFGDIHMPTAAQVTFSSALSAWNNTVFTLAAAKAAAERRVSVQITFTQGERDTDEVSPCTLTAVIQREANAQGSQRIKWSCDLLQSKAHNPPNGWHFTDASKRTMVPLGSRHATDDAGQSEQQRRPVWQLGEEVTAYDSLLWDAAIGNKAHFANIDEVLAAWQLWTPVVEAAEKKRPALPTNNGAKNPDPRVYPLGTTPWSFDRQGALSSDASTVKSSVHAVDEL